MRGVIEIGEDCIFRSVGWSNPVGADRPCTVSTLQEGARVLIGRNCGFSATVIAAAEEIVIGDNVLCGSNVTITDSDWHDSAPSHQYSSGGTAPVRIEDDVFLGLGVIVLKGVTIGKGSVVGAGSVVTRSLPPMAVAVGSPARIVRSLEDPPHGAQGVTPATAVADATSA